MTPQELDIQTRQAFAIDRRKRDELLRQQRAVQSTAACIVDATVFARGMKGSHFQPLHYALILRDATGAKINGTGSAYDLDGTRRFASSLLRTMPSVLFIDIHPFINGICHENAVETVHREGCNGQA